MKYVLLVIVGVVNLSAMLALQVTHNVACLARWMAADLYLREVDVLRFEVSHSFSHTNCLHMCLPP